MLPKSYVMLALGVMLPLTTNPVSVPTLVIFGCAFVVTVPAVVALPDVLAYVAFATAPVTLDPDTLNAVPAKLAKLALATFDTLGTAANIPLPYKMLLKLPSKFTVAMFPIPDTLATATLFALAATVALLAVLELTANVAFATAPDTFAPATLNALPAKLAKFAVVAVMPVN